VLRRIPALLIVGAILIASTAVGCTRSGAPLSDTSDSSQVETRLGEPGIVTNLSAGQSVPILGLRCTIPAGWRAAKRVPEPAGVREMSADLEINLEPQPRTFYVMVSAFPARGSRDATGNFESASYRRVAVPQSVRALSDTGIPEVAQYQKRALVAYVPRRQGDLQIVVGLGSGEATSSAQLVAWLNQAASMFSR